MLLQPIPTSSAALSLGADDIALIRSADTFFLGTTHPERGNDASHRGGPAGFVHVDHNTVEWPDYPGNNMFNSFGNLEIDPTAALLFIDFDSGRTLQLSGRAVVDWEKSAARAATPAAGFGSPPNASSGVGGLRCDESCGVRRSYCRTLTEEDFWCAA